MLNLENDAAGTRLSILFVRRGNDVIQHVDHVPDLEDLSLFLSFYSLITITALVSVIIVCVCVAVCVSRLGPRYESIPACSLMIMTEAIIVLYDDTHTGGRTCARVHFSCRLVFMGPSALLLVACLFPFIDAGDVAAVNEPRSTLRMRNRGVVAVFPAVVENGATIWPHRRE